MLHADNNDGEDLLLDKEFLDFLATDVDSIDEKITGKTPVPRTGWTQLPTSFALETSSSLRQNIEVPSSAPRLCPEQYIIYPKHCESNVVQQQARTKL